MKHVSLAYDAVDTKPFKLWTCAVCDPVAPHAAWWGPPLVLALELEKHDNLSASSQGLSASSLQLPIGSAK